MFFFLEGGGGVIVVLRANKVAMEQMALINTFWPVLINGYELTVEIKFY